MVPMPLKIDVTALWTTREPMEVCPAAHSEPKCAHIPVILS